MPGDRRHGWVADGAFGPSGRRETYGALVELIVDQLQDLAAEQGIAGRCRMGKDQLLEALRPGQETPTGARP
jgi:hypothetical protein